MIAETIKMLREKNELTQVDLAKKLGVTRSSVNAWELGISSPSTQYLIELSKIFKVSVDYLLGLSQNSSLNLDGLTPEDIEIVYELANYLRRKNK